MRGPLSPDGQLLTTTQRVQGQGFPAWPVAAGSLISGFAVAQVTGVRPLGGLVLAAGAAWCGLRWHREAGVGIAVGLLAVYLAAFAAAHVLADALSAWGAVLTVAATVALASLLAADRRRPA